MNERLSHIARSPIAHHDSTTHARTYTHTRCMRERAVGRRAFGLTAVDNDDGVVA